MPARAGLPGGFGGMDSPGREQSRPPEPAMRSAPATRSAELFRSRFGGTPDGVWLAPGRANLMGEHTDYNDGFVLPFALGQAVTAAAARRAGPGFPGSRRLTLCSRQEPAAAVEIALDGLAPGQVTGWAAYPAGIAWALEAAGHRVPGACVAIDSDVPAGAGLSSSAALECATALVLTDWHAELAGCRAANWPRSPAGPRTSSSGCPRASWTSPPRCSASPATRCCSTAARLTPRRCRSTPPRRARACCSSTPGPSTTSATGSTASGGPSAKRPPAVLGIPSLRYLTNLADVDRLADPVLRRRARHVLTDNQRVLDVVALLSTPPAPPGRPGHADAYRDIGRLLTQAHASLRDDFEVSWPEADTTVEAALAAGAFGARMIGGGFGGSVLALVPATAGGPVRAAITDAFARHAWTAPEFLDAVPSASARRIALQ